MLGSLLPQVVFGYALVLTRIAAMLMIVPALGENSIPARIRLGLALMVTLVIYPAVAGGLPALPDTPIGLAHLLVIEILVGFFIGATARLVMAALNLAGTIIAFQGGLSVAQGFDPTQGTQGAITGTFLTLLATVLIFAADLHHLLLAAILNSFQQFPAGQFPNVGDFAELATGTLATAFRLAIQIAAPFLAYGLIFYIGLGMVARLMPQLQVFFIAMPLNILLSLLILMVVLGVAMTWFLDSFRDILMVFTG